MEKKNQVNEQQGSSNKGLVIVLAILVIALGGLSGYLYTEVVSFEEQYMDSQEVVKEKEENIDDLEAEMQEKIAEYEALSKSYDELGIESDSIKALTEQLKAEVKTWKSRTWASQAELKKARKEMETRLAQIQLDLAAKTEEVERLTLANDSLSASVDSLITANGYANENITSLSEKVELASILKAEAIAVSVLNDKDKELVKDEYKSKQIDRVRVTFNLADNKVAKKDLKSIVLQIVEPKGSVLFDIEQGGGSFAKADGHNDFYTKKQMIDFTNTRQPVNFFYQKGSEYESGTYKVIIFGDGHEIGASEFIVK